MQRLGRRLTWLSAGTVLLIATTAHADTVERGGWHHGMHGWGGWVFGPVMMLLFFALLVGAVIVITRLLGRNGPGRSGRTDRALDILHGRELPCRQP